MSLLSFGTSRVMGNTPVFTGDQNERFRLFSIGVTHEVTPAEATRWKLMFMVGFVLGAALGSSRTRRG